MDMNGLRGHLNANLFYMELILAPLAGYTDKAFREIALGFGADAAVTEMVSAEGLARSSEKTFSLIEKAEGEENLIIQLFGPDPDPFRRCIPNLMKVQPKMIDINCGCPVPKVVKTGAGSALMNTPDRIYDIVKILKDETDAEISVKFRLGWNQDHMNYLEFAHKAVDAGATMLTMHARTRTQQYSGVAQKEHFTILRNEFPKGCGIRLFASGDVFSAEDALEYLDMYDMDGVMFARGAIGNPFIFRETRELREKGCYRKPSVQERKETALRHLERMIHYYGEEHAGKEMRKHAMAYIKGISGANRTKALLTTAITYDDYRKALDELMG